MLKKWLKILIKTEMGVLPFRIICSGALVVNLSVADSVQLPFVQSSFFASTVCFHTSRGSMEFSWPVWDRKSIIWRTHTWCFGFLTQVMLGKPEIIGKSGQAYQKNRFPVWYSIFISARESCYRDGSQEAVYQALAAEVFSQWLVDPNYSVAGWGFRWPLKTSWDIHSVNHIIILVTWGIWSFQNLLKDLWLKTLLQTSGSRCRIGPKSRWRCADPGGHGRKSVFARHWTCWKVGDQQLFIQGIHEIIRHPPFVGGRRVQTYSSQRFMTS